MARSLRDAKLDTREARLRLKARGKPYWRFLEPGLHLGYRRLGAKPGTWCVRRYAGGQTYTVVALGSVADDYSEADGAFVFNFKQAQRAALAHKPKMAGVMTVADAVDAYLRHLEDSGKATDDARYRTAALILPAIGNTELAALTTKHLQGLLAALAKAPAKHRPDASSDEARRRRRSSANRTFNNLRAALNLAYREGHVTSDAAWRRVKPFKGVDAARLRYLSIAEAQRLINACDPDLRRLVQAALATGCRYGELARLRVHDFNVDAGTVTVRQSKSGRPRSVFLTDEGVALFRRWSAGQAGDVLLFTRDGEAWRKSSQNRVMQLACGRAGIERIAFHGLRHTYASHALMAGAPLLVVARNLGHADGRMCELHYGHLSASHIRDSIRAAAPRFGLSDDTTVVPLRRP